MPSCAAAGARLSPMKHNTRGEKIMLVGAALAWTALGIYSFGLMMGW